METMISAFAHLMMYLKEPDYLYDLHSSMFSLVTGIGLIGWGVREHNPLLWGCLIVSFGILRVYSILRGSIRMHSVSCLLSSMSWIFIQFVCFISGHYLLSFMFATFTVSSLIRYLQLEWWKQTGAVIARR